MPIRALISICLVMLVLNGLSVYSITKRNDHDYPRTIVYSYRDLWEDLERLRRLNDETVNKYIDEIEGAVAAGDYTKLLELLKRLSEYLESMGYVGESYDHISLLAKLLKAIESAGPRGLEISYERLDSTIRKLLEIAGLREFIVSIDVDKLLAALNELIRGISRESDAQRDLSNGLEEPRTDLPDFPSNPGPAPNVFGELPVPEIALPFSVQDLTRVLPFVAVAGLAAFLLVLLVRAKRKELGAVDLLNSIKRGARALRGLLPGARIALVDTIVSLYNRWYSIAKSRGYSRVEHETLREYLSRVSSRELQSVGSKVTSLYEDRIYGEKDVSDGVVEEVRGELSRLETERS